MDYRALILVLVSLHCFAQWGVNFFNPDNNYVSVNSTNTRQACQWRSLETFTVSKVAYNANSVTTGGTVRISLQYSDASGLPSGTELAYAERNITASGHYADTLSQSVQISGGTPFWVVVEGVPLGSVNISFHAVGVSAYANQTYISSTSRLHYATATFSGGLWSGGTNVAPMPGFIPMTSDNTPIPIELLTVAAYATSASTSSNPNESGLACTFNRPVLLVGIGRTRTAGGTEDSEYRVYRNGVQIAAFQSVQLPSRGQQSVFYQAIDPMLLVPGVEHIISFKPLSTTSQNVYMYQARYNTIGDFFKSLWFLKDSCENVSRQGTGAWSRGASAKFWDVRPLFQEVGVSWH